MIRQSSFKVNGKEIRNPILRFIVLITFLAVGLGILAGVSGILIGPLVMLAVGTALLLISHSILRILGKQGFIKKKRFFEQRPGSILEKISYEVDISGNSFKTTAL